MSCMRVGRNWRRSRRRRKRSGENACRGWRLFHLQGVPFDKLSTGFRLVRLAPHFAQDDRVKFELRNTKQQVLRFAQEDKLGCVTNFCRAADTIGNARG